MPASESRPVDPSFSGDLGGSKRNIIDLLKRSDGAAVVELATTLGLTTAAIRQHLDALEGNGLVERVDGRPTGARGRPASRWALTATAFELFPDRHRELTVELIAAVREAVGDDGLDQVIRARTARQLDLYRGLVERHTELGDRVHGLAEQRTREGYLAEVEQVGDTYLLTEHHCPICEAAMSCTQLCRDELELFGDVLGPGARVERVAHLLVGDARCTYQVTPVKISGS